ncbi:MAG: 1-(5-phosphoribosyl)-5-amino-4-imidazole-carboxylate carboxylase, partial [Candidatus Micrarchaeota archaeon]
MRRHKYEDLGFSKVDHQRMQWKGFPEVIFCKGKTREQIVRIFVSLMRKGHNVLATRASKDAYSAVKKICKKAQYSEH